MPPLCNYNNNDDDDFATEYVIQDAYTQTTVFSLLLFLHWCQLLLSGWLKNREPFFYWGSPNSWKNDDTQLPNSFRVFLVSGWMSLLGKRIAQDGSERAPNRCLPRRASHTENWAAWGDTRDFPLPVSMWLCGTGDKTFKTRTTPEGRAVSCATRFLQCVSLKNLEAAVSRGFQSHWRSLLQVLLIFPSWPITTTYFFSQYFWPFPYLSFQEVI